MLLRGGPDEEVTEQAATNSLKAQAICEKVFCLEGGRLKMVPQIRIKKTLFVFWGLSFAKLKLCFCGFLRLFVTFCGSLLQSLLTFEFSCCHQRVVFWRIIMTGFCQISLSNNWEFLSWSVARLLCYVAVYRWITSVCLFTRTTFEASLTSRFSV